VCVRERDSVYFRVRLCVCVFALRLFVFVPVELAGSFVSLFVWSFVNWLCVCVGGGGGRSNPLMN